MQIAVKLSDVRNAQTTVKLSEANRLLRQHGCCQSRGNVVVTVKSRVSEESS